MGSPTNGPGTAIPTPDDASQVGLPADLEDSVTSSLSQNVTLTGYTSDRAPQELGDWYEQQLTQGGWELLKGEGTVKIWKKGDTGIGIALMPAAFAGSQVDMPDSAQTLIVLMKDDFSNWQTVLTGIRGEAQLTEDGAVVFTPEETYPSPIPAGEYEYQLQTVTQDVANGSHPPQTQFKPGAEPLENGVEAALDLQDAQVGDILVMKHEQRLYTFWVMNQNGSVPPSAMAGASNGSVAPHGGLN